MQLEFHQLDRRWEHLRVRHPARQRRLLASLAEVGQQTPIVVLVAEGQADRYVVIDGYKRIAALEQLGRDTVEAVVWPMSEAAAVLLDRSLRFISNISSMVRTMQPAPLSCWLLVQSSLHVFPNPIRACPIAALLGHDCPSQRLAYGAADEPSDAVCLPTGGAHEFVERCAAFPP